MDVCLPGIDGVNALGRIRSLSPTPPPIVIMTPFGSLDVAVRSLATGAFDYPPKPWLSRHLAALTPERQRAPDVSPSCSRREVFARTAVLREPLRAVGQREIARQSTVSPARRTEVRRSLLNLPIALTTRQFGGVSRPRRRFAVLAWVKTHATGEGANHQSSSLPELRPTGAGHAAIHWGRWLGGSWPTLLWRVVIQAPLAGP